MENMALHTPSHSLTHAPAHAHTVYGPEISDIQVLPLIPPLDRGSEAIRMCSRRYVTVQHNQEFYASNLNHLGKKTHILLYCCIVVCLY